MKNFLLKIFYFLIIMAGINFIISYFANKAYFDGYEEYSLKHSAYILSDSHGLSLGEFGEKYGVYNFSAGSDSYFDMKRKLNFVIEKGKVDTVYITADDHMLSKYREMANNEDRSRVYATREDYSGFFEFVKEKYVVGNIVLLQPKTCSVVKAYLASLIRDAVMGSKKEGKQKEWSSLTPQKRQKKSEERFVGQFPSDDISERLKETLLEIVATCRKNNIVLIGIKYPLAKEYIDLMGTKSYHADKVLEEQGIKVIDYKKLFYGRSELFSNQDHMNEKGGALFIEELLGKN